MQYAAEYMPCYLNVEKEPISQHHIPFKAFKLCLYFHAVQILL